MTRIILALSILLLPAAAGAPPLPKEEYFQAYVRYVDHQILADRMEQLFDLLAPAAKTQAKAILKADLQAAIQEVLDEINAREVTPYTTLQADVGDTDL